MNSRTLFDNILTFTKKLIESTNIDISANKHETIIKATGDVLNLDIVRSTESVDLHANYKQAHLRIIKDETPSSSTIVNFKTKPTAN